MFSNAQRKSERLNSGLPDFITKNTYNLIIGAVVLYGIIVNAIMVATCGPLFANMNMIAFLIGYFVLVLLGVFITRSNNPIASFVGYNLVVVPIGAVVSVCIPGYDNSAILSAIIVTGIVVAVMIFISASFPKVFAKMGGALFVAIPLVVASEGLLIAKLFAALSMLILFSALSLGGVLGLWVLVHRRFYQEHRELHNRNGSTSDL